MSQSAAQTHFDLSQYLDETADKDANLPHLLDRLPEEAVFNPYRDSQVSNPLKQSQSMLIRKTPPKPAPPYMKFLDPRKQDLSIVKLKMPTRNEHFQRIVRSKSTGDAKSLASAEYHLNQVQNAIPFCHEARNAHFLLEFLHFLNFFAPLLRLIDFEPGSNVAV